MRRLPVDRCSALELRARCSRRHCAGRGARPMFRIRRARRRATTRRSSPSRWQQRGGRRGGTSGERANVRGRTNRREYLEEQPARSSDPRIELIAHRADLAMLVAAGDLERAERALGGGRRRLVALPLAAAVARLLWIDALRRAQPRARCRAAVSGELRRVADAPNLLKREIASRESGHAAVARTQPAVASAAGSTICAAFVRLAQADEDDQSAVSLLLAQPRRGAPDRSRRCCEQEAGSERA